MNTNCIIYHDNSATGEIQHALHGPVGDQQASNGQHRKARERINFHSSFGDPTELVYVMVWRFSSLVLMEMISICHMMTSHHGSNCCLFVCLFPIVDEQ